MGLGLWVDEVEFVIYGQVFVSPSTKAFVCPPTIRHNCTSRLNTSFNNLNKGWGVSLLDRFEEEASIGGPAFHSTKHPLDWESFSIPVKLLSKNHFVNFYYFPWTSYAGAALVIPFAAHLPII